MSWSLILLVADDTRLVTNVKISATLKGGRNSADISKPLNENDKSDFHMNPKLSWESLVS